MRGDEGTDLPTTGPGAESGPHADPAHRQPIAYPISVTDAIGQRRHGSIFLLPRWPPETPLEGPPDHDEFRIVILQQPPPEPVRPHSGTLICVPAQPLNRLAAVREPVATYGTKGRRQQGLLPLSPADIRVLREGQIVAPTELTLGPQDVFLENHLRLELLAKEFLASEELYHYLQPLATALSAPATPSTPSRSRTLAELADLVRAVASSPPTEDNGAVPVELEEALARLSQLTACQDAESALILSRRLYPNPGALVEDTCLVRAFHQRPLEALKLLKMRRFLAEAAVPPQDSELMLDRAIVLEQLQFATLLTEP